MADVLGIGKLLKEGYYMVLGSRGEREKQRHEQVITDAGLTRESLEQFAAEFQDQKSKSLLNDLVNFLNRLPRPAITFAVLYSFYLAIDDPQRFGEIATQLAVVPDGYWALLGVVISFYFGGRMQIKAQDFRFKESAAKGIAASIEAQKQIREALGEEETEVEKLGDAAERVLGTQKSTVLETFKQENPEKVKRKRFGPRKRRF